VIPGAAGFVLLSLLGSCGFADLRPIGLEITPGEAEGLLPDYDSPVILSFDTKMEELETQGILSVSSPGEQVEGDLEWKGNALYFTPIGGWKAGSRYILALSGQVYAADGRDLRLAEYIPFYALTRAPLPRVLSFSSDGASVGVSLETGLTLTFSAPMDRRSTEGGFSLEGVADREFRWEEDDRLLRIIPDKPLSPWSVYRWTLDKALSREGAPLVKSASALFVTGADREIPRVTEVFPMIPSGPPPGEGSAAIIPWVGTGAGIDRGLGSGQGIGLRFNKPMDRDSLLRAVRIEPSLPGRTEVLTDTLMVFIPDRDGEGETVYTLTVSGDTKDRSGLTLGEDHTVFFTPDIPFLEITGISLNGVTLPNGGPLNCRIPMEDSYKGILEITLSFSLPFSREAAVEAALGIFLEPWFPVILGPVSLKALTWSSEDTFEMEWDGVSPGEIPEPHYYRLSIPGGKSGVTNGLGSAMKESRIIYIEAAKP
jgi:hypothetical protein